MFNDFIETLDYDETDEMLVIKNLCSDTSLEFSKDIISRRNDELRRYAGSPQAKKRIEHNERLLSFMDRYRRR